VAATGRTAPPAAGSRSSSGRRPLRRRLAFAALLALLVLFVAEVGGALAWWAMTGDWFTWSGAQQARREVLADDAAARADDEGDDDGEREQRAAQRAANRGSVVHPFLGFVSDADLGPVAGFPVTRYGFLDDAPPLPTRAPDRFVVALTGGSLALQLALYAEDVLIAELQKSPLVAGREVEVVRLALGGWKQPQQLFAAQLSWLRGGEFDLLLNLDGFNEVALVPENVDYDVPGWFPRGWRRLMDRVPTPAQQRRIGQLVVLREQRRDAAASAETTWWSPTLQCLWLASDRRRAQRIAELAREVERGDAAATFAMTGPGTEGRDRDASRVEMVDVWSRASRALDALCAQHGARYFHFLQPNQHLPDSKPIGAEEARVAFAEATADMSSSVRHAYPLLRERGRQLRRAGVSFTDLTQVFRDHDEPLYVDACCHVGRRGYEILATAIAAAVRRELDLADFVAERLEAPRQRLVFRSPAEAEALRVRAVAADGRELDVSSTGMGARYTATPAGLLDVREDGSARALRRGEGELVVAFGGHELRLPVVADWPDELVLEDGRPCADAQPRLRVAAASDDGLQLVCAGLPQGPFRVLATSHLPLPADVRPGERARQVVTAVLDGEGETVTVPAPTRPTPDAPLFVRVYLVDPRTAELVCASNGLVLSAR